MGIFVIHNIIHIPYKVYHAIITSVVYITIWKLITSLFSNFLFFFSVCFVQKTFAVILQCLSTPNSSGTGLRQRSFATTVTDSSGKHYYIDTYFFFFYRCQTRHVCCSYLPTFSR